MTMIRCAITRFITRRRHDNSILIGGPYSLGPDSAPQEGVPRGTVATSRWTSETIYPGTERDTWVYVPAQYDGSQAACLMVFQDGEMCLGAEINVPVVFDNLIHTGAMPVTIGLFVNPGSTGPGKGADNRRFEYDSLGDQYAQFLIEELLPDLEARYSIVKDPSGRAICGISSGGICAFTVAWERPDVFGKVVSHCGSFVDIRGGHMVPLMIRRATPKPIRVFLQTGAKDADLICGSWPLANHEMAAAIAYRNYDFQFVFGEGGHNLKHGGAIFPDTMRWLWRDYPKSV